MKPRNLSYVDFEPNEVRNDEVNICSYIRAGCCGKNNEFNLKDQ